MHKIIIPNLCKLISLDNDKDFITNFHLLKSTFNANQPNNN